MSSYAKIYYEASEGEEVHMIPVGIALWCSETAAFVIRSIRSDEMLPGRDLSPEARMLIDTIVDEVSHWASDRRIPGRMPSAPWSDAFWLDVKNMMVHRVRLSDPKAVAEHDAEGLFRAIVKPLSRPTPKVSVVSTAPKIEDASWLKGHEAFVKGYEYAATQNRAIPALSKCSPEEMFFAYEAIKRGFDRAVDVHVNGGPSA